MRNSKYETDLREGFPKLRDGEIYAFHSSDDVINNIYRYCDVFIPHRDVRWRGADELETIVIKAGTVLAGLGGCPCEESKFVLGTPFFLGNDDRDTIIKLQVSRRFKHRYYNIPLYPEFEGLTKHF